MINFLNFCSIHSQSQVVWRVMPYLRNWHVEQKNSQALPRKSIVCTSSILHRTKKQFQLGVSYIPYYCTGNYFNVFFFDIPSCMSLWEATVKNIMLLFIKLPGHFKVCMFSMCCSVWILFYDSLKQMLSERLNYFIIKFKKI